MVAYKSSTDRPNENYKFQTSLNICLIQLLNFFHTMELKEWQYLYRQYAGVKRKGFGVSKICSKNKI